jgi:glycosyltransferase involved in cell wall biosynthesis
VFFLATTKETQFDDFAPSDLPDAIRNLLTSADKPFTFCFIGTFNKTQHPALVLNAIDLLRKKTNLVSDNVAFLIGGDGIDAEVVKRRAAEVENVHFLGWLRPRQIQAVLSRSDVGLLPMNFASEAFNNKAFAYLASGLPIINCAVGDLRQLIDDERIGVNVDAGNPQALAQAMHQLLSDRSATREMSARVKNLYSKRFNQEKVYEDYAAHVELIAGAGRAR